MPGSRLRSITIGERSAFEAPMRATLNLDHDLVGTVDRSIRETIWERRIDAAQIGDSSI